MPRIRVRKKIVIALGLAVGLATVGSRAAGGASGVRIVRMMDQCDPASFNAAIGPGTEAALLRRPTASLSTRASFPGSAR